MSCNSKYRPSRPSPEAEAYFLIFRESRTTKPFIAEYALRKLFQELEPHLEYQIQLIRDRAPSYFGMDDIRQSLIAAVLDRLRKYYSNQNDKVRLASVLWWAARTAVTWWGKKFEREESDGVVEAEHRGDSDGS